MKEKLELMKNRNTTFNGTLLALSLLALSALAQAVTPTPDGGYPGGNTAEGTNALFSRTTGGFNTALGGFALYSDTTGSTNTAVGFNALRHNVDGISNTAVGLNALFTNVGHANTELGCFNSAFGKNALFANTDGARNSAFGLGALALNNTGSSNTAVGDRAMNHNTSGSYNTALGVFALGVNTIGNSNTATGAGALEFNINGDFNTADGVGALESNISGSNNTASGDAALVYNTDSSYNTAIGANALRNAINGANTAVGYNAGSAVTTGSFNVYIGPNVNGLADEVGHTYISNINSTIQPPINGSEYVTVHLADGLLGHTSSSQRYKEDIKPMESASEVLYRLKPVTYRYKKEIDPSQSLDYGLVAEDVAEVDAHLAIRNGNGQIESVRYSAINAMLLNEFLKENCTVHEQAREIEQRATIINELTNAMNSVVVRLKEHDSKIEKVSAQIQVRKAALQTAAAVQ